MFELRLICERQELAYDTVAKQLHRCRVEGQTSLDFDLADKLLCGMRLRWDHDELLHEYYKAVDLSWRECAHPDCQVRFRINAPRHCYCSRACKDSAAKGNRRVKHFRGKAQRFAHSGHCRNGHKRTEANTIQLKNGKIRCRVCNNATSRAGWLRRRQALAA